MGLHYAMRHQSPGQTMYIFRVLTNRSWRASGRSYQWRGHRSKLKRRWWPYKIYTTARKFIKRPGIHWCLSVSCGGLIKGHTETPRNVTAVWYQGVKRAVLNGAPIYGERCQLLSIVGSLRPVGMRSPAHNAEALGFNHYHYRPQSCAVSNTNVHTVHGVILANFTFSSCILTRTAHSSCPNTFR